MTDRPCADTLAEQAAAERATVLGQAEADDRMFGVGWASVSGGKWRWWGPEEVIGLRMRVVRPDPLQDIPDETRERDGAGAARERDEVRMALEQEDGEVELALHTIATLAAGRAGLGFDDGLALAATTLRNMAAEVERGGVPPDLTLADALRIAADTLKPDVDPSPYPSCRSSDP